MKIQTRKYTPDTVQKALHDAQQIGIAGAARRYDLPSSILRYHAKQQGIRTPHVHAGNSSPRNPELDGELAVLHALFPAYSFSQTEIAEILGRISKQGVCEIEKRALRKVRHAMLVSRLWQEIQKRP